MTLATLVAAGYHTGRRIIAKAPTTGLMARVLGTYRRRTPPRHRGGVFALAGVLLDLVARLESHNVFAVAAQVAFYSFLAIFPALASLGFFYAVLGDPARLPWLVASLGFLLPADVSAFLAEHALRLSANASASAGAIGLLSFALVVFSASSGMMALVEGLDIAFETAETRSILVLRLRAIVLTLVGMLMISALLLLLGQAHHLAVRAGWPAVAFEVMRWPVAIAIAAIALASLYHYGPNRDRRRWRFFTVGSVSAAAAWVAASHGLAWYLANFPGFGLTYGSLAALAGFLFWVWLSAIIAIVGAELDALIERVE